MPLTPTTYFTQFYLKSTFYYLSLRQKQVCDTGMNEAVVKIHKKMKIGIPEKGTFSAATSKVNAFQAEIWGL